MHSGKLEAYRGGLVIDGRYRLIRYLGEGAMGWVWLARHETLELLVALKISKPESEASSLQEARLTATLRHPSIVAVLDSGRMPLGHSYFVMEHLDGTSLADVLGRDQRLPVGAAVSLLLPLLDALEHCHERGVVHRDLKPGNIFLTHSDKRRQTKLLDFGVAASCAAAHGRAELVGTPGYMAPEQVRCELELDHRADLWSFCVVLYEAVADEPAIRGEDCVELLHASIEPVIAPLGDRARGAALLWPVLERGLRARPEERFQSASELREALQALDFGRVDARAAQKVQPVARLRRHAQWGLAPRSPAAAQTIAVA